VKQHLKWYGQAEASSEAEGRIVILKETGLIISANLSGLQIFPEATRNLNAEGRK